MISVEMENALALIEKLVTLSESLADAVEQLALLLPEPEDYETMEADLERMMTATLSATNSARQFVAVVREDSI